ncbi:glycoside hydrolase family 104 protein [Candidatus Dependentiae bacterium]|nr:glycoside hydrolase family 104 protein [Candidatus Dependentiae bacterium]
MKSYIKLLIFFIFFGSNSLAKIFEPKNVDEVKNYLKKYSRAIVFFGTNDSSDKLTLFKAASENHEFKNIAEIAFIHINLNNSQLSKLPIQYNLSHIKNSCVLFFNSKPIFENDSTDILKSFSTKSNITMFIKKHWQNYLDEILDTKYPVDIKILKAYLYNKKIKAFLDTIAHVEGTFKPEGYRMCFTGKLFEDFSDHPRIKICANINGKQVCSTAAGRYQFLARTWDKISKKIGTNSFHPKNQDLGAIVLLHQADALKDIVAGKINSAIFKLNGLWASFPDAPYGQQSVPMTLRKIMNIYEERLSEHLLRK